MTALSTTLSSPCCGESVSLVHETQPPADGPRLEVRSLWQCECCARLWETTLTVRPAVAREWRIRRVMAEVAS